MERKNYQTALSRCRSEIRSYTFLLKIKAYQNSEQFIFGYETFKSVPFTSHKKIKKLAGLVLMIFRLVTTRIKTSIENISKTQLRSVNKNKTSKIKSLSAKRQICYSPKLVTFNRVLYKKNARTDQSSTEHFLFFNEKPIKVQPSIFWQKSTNRAFPTDDFFLNWTTDHSTTEHFFNFEKTD